MALSLTILQTPSQSTTSKMYPVYNGLPFVVKSNNYNRNNFKFISDVFVGGTKVSQLKQNKDISANNYGVFDIGRIVENFIKSKSPTSLTFGFVGDTKAYQSYQIKFGAEYDRVINFNSIINYAGQSILKFNGLEGTHDCRVGDRIVITTNTANTSLNGMATVLITGAPTILINKPYYGNGTGTIIEGEGFYDNVFGTGGFVGFAIPISRPTRINIGDTVVVIQDAGATFPSYNSEWLCTNIYNQVIGATTYQIILTNCPFLGSTPVQGGAIYSQNKYKYTGITTSTLEYAFDGALQYDTLNSWTPATYSMNLTNLGKFLTNSPTNQKIQLNEDAKLTCFNTSIVNSSTIRKGAFKTYDSAGTLLATYAHNLGGTALTTAVLNIGVGTKNLIALNASALNNVASYTYELRNLTNQRLSEIRTYTIDDTCYRHTQKRFKWKNRMGGWDYFTFTLRSDRTVNIQKSNYRKTLNTFNSTTNKYGYAIGDRGNTTFNVNARDSELVYSNWLSGNEATWLEELFTSPEVYVIDGTNELPIILTDTSLVIGEDENLNLIMYSVNYEYAFNKVIQRA